MEWINLDEVITAVNTDRGQAGGGVGTSNGICYGLQVMVKIHQQVQRNQMVEEWGMEQHGQTETDVNT